MPHTKPGQDDWPVLLDNLILAKREIKERDPATFQPFTRPRAPATERDITALEDRVGERIDEHYRRFLLHANGWTQVYFELGFFGTEEFNGGGNQPLADRHLAGYEREGALRESGLDMRQVMPIAAGEGMVDLIAVVRSGRPDAGTVVWIDGIEYRRASDFTSFFRTLIADARQEAEELAKEQNGQ